MRKHGTKKQWINRPIQNLPNLIGKETGLYKIDLYGCWHEVQVIESTTLEHPIGTLFWMIGEYPNGACR